MESISMYNLKKAVEAASQLEFSDALIKCAEIFKHRKVVAEELIFTIDEEKVRILKEQFIYYNKQIKLILGLWEEND